jgi:hypothetical protein
MLVY